MSRFAWCVLLLGLGCSGDHSQPDLVWGRKGVRDGDLARPRACAIDGHDRLYIVDFTARIQVYDLDGKHLGLTWTTPDYRKGRLCLRQLILWAVSPRAVPSVAPCKTRPNRRATLLHGRSFLRGQRDS